MDYCFILVIMYKLYVILFVGAITVLLFTVCEKHVIHFTTVVSLFTGLLAVYSLR